MPEQPMRAGEPAASWRSVLLGQLWRTALTRLGLQFVDPGLEAAFRHDHCTRLMSQVRYSLMLGSLLYLVLGLQDLWFFPDRYHWIWLLRLAVVAVLIMVYTASHRPFFKRWLSVILAAATVVAGLGPITMIAVGSAEVAASYHLGLVLVVVWGYTFSGLRFTPAAFANALLILAYLGMSLATRHQLKIWLVANFTNLLAASLLAGFASCMIERQRRNLFYRTVVLDAERRSHEQMAMSDHLTGLPNRSCFERHIETALQKARSSALRLALIFIDINDFKRINDTYGHHGGDQALVALARNMKRALRANDMVARIGGDEFVALLNEINERDDAEKVSDKLKAALVRPVVIRAPDGSSAIVPVSASIGMAVYPDDGDDYLSLLRAADAAMYQDKFAPME